MCSTREGSSLTHKQQFWLHRISVVKHSNLICSFVTGENFAKLKKHWRGRLLPHSQQQSWLDRISVDKHSSLFCYFIRDKNGAKLIKHFLKLQNKLECLPLASLPGLGKTRSLPSQSPQVMALASFSNNRLGQYGFPVTNTLAYFVSS